MSNWPGCTFTLPHGRGRYRAPTRRISLANKQKESRGLHAVRLLRFRGGAPFGEKSWLSATGFSLTIEHFCHLLQKGFHSMALNLTINATNPPLGELQFAVIAGVMVCVATLCDSYINKYVWSRSAKL